MDEKRGSGIGKRISLDRLLVELYAKRKWLDDVIAGLHAVEHTPEVELVTAVEEILGKDWSPKPKVDLIGRKKRRLRPLLARIKNRTPFAHGSDTPETNVPG